MTRDDEIVRRVRDGESITTIGADLGITRQRVSQIMHKHGVRFPLPRQVIEGRRVRAVLVTLAAKGLSLDEIAGESGQSRGRVYRSLITTGRRFPRAKSPIKHGTRNAYQYHKCRCEECLAASSKSVRDYYLAHPGRYYATSRAYAKRHPDRPKAWHKVHDAIASGRLIRPDKCACGRAVRLHAHHDDYRKPLEVLWLCALCHKARHTYLKSIGRNPE